MIMRTIYVTFILFVLFSCASRKNNINVDAIDTFASSYFPANEPGGAIVIMKHDSIIFSKGYGIADLKRLKLSADGFAFDANELVLPIPQREIDASKNVISQNAGY